MCGKCAAPPGFRKSSTLQPSSCTTPTTRPRISGARSTAPAENGYTSIEGESADERVITSYSGDIVLDCGAADRKVILVNATGKAGLYAKLPACPRMIRVFDVTGRETQAELPSAGLVSLPVPSSGYAELAW